MANASHDENSVATLTAALNTTGASIIKVQANASNHGLSVNDDVTGSDHGPAHALRDENNIPTLLAVSSADGITPVVVYADSSGNLLIDSN